MSVLDDEIVNVQKLDPYVEARNMYYKVLKHVVNRVVQSIIERRKAKKDIYSLNRAYMISVPITYCSHIHGMMIDHDLKVNVMVREEHVSDIVRELDNYLIETIPDDAQRYSVIASSLRVYEDQMYRVLQLAFADWYSRYSI